MIPAAFDYARAKSVDDALKALAAGDGTKVVAGGQSLLPLLRFRLGETPRLVDIAQLDDLKGVRKDGDSVRIGGATTYRDLMDSDVLAKSHPIMKEVTAHIGDIQVRNLGTIAGGLVHADPASDMPAVLLALDATFTLRSQDGERSLAAAEFFEGAFVTAMKENELLVEIHLPALPKGAGTAYVSFEQKASGFALVGAAAVVTTSKGKVTRADLAFTGISESPFLVESAAKLVGTKAGADDIDAVAAAAVQGIEANDDIHAPAPYRLHLGEVAARRALTQAVERTG